MKATILLLATAGLASSVLAQQPSPTPDASAPKGHRPPPPLVRALDANKDRVISAEEIANAAAALLTLDANADGQLSAAEIAPPKPRRRDDGDRSRSDRAQRPPKPGPLVEALDADRDKVISAAEIAGAPAALATVDKNGDGQLTPPEFAPKPRRQKPGGGPKPTPAPTATPA